MKRPSFQFYPADWRVNAKLRRCSHAERGIWLDVMCFMHDSDEYGILRWPLADIAQAIGCRPENLRALRKNGVLKGADTGERCSAYVHQGYHARQPLPPVTLVPEQDGPLWFSSRMVLDEYLRSRRGADTRFSEERQPTRSLNGSPDHSPTRRQGERQGAAPTRRQGDGATSSSSSSIKTKPPVVPLAGDRLFVLFWDAYPRKVAKPAAQKAWNRLNIDEPLLATLLETIERQRQSEKWQKDGGEYIPHPATWLNQRRWEDELGVANPAPQASSAGLCHCGELGAVKNNNGQWLCRRHREAA